MKLTKAKLKKLEKRERNKKDKEWALAVKQEFDNRCAVCGDVCNLNSHHLIPREIKYLRHEVLNGVCLCALHHRFSLKLSAHRNPLMFYDFYSIVYKSRYNQLINLCKVVTIIK